MNKSFVGIISCFLFALIIAGSQVFAETQIQYRYKYNKIPIKQPVLTENMKPAVEMYKQGNYLGAMVELKEVVEKDKNNDYAKYYLALCYTQLGYETEANQCFRDIVEADKNYTLSYYSQKAMACLDNPNSEKCLPPQPKKIPTVKKEEKKAEVAQNEAETEVQQEEVDDITQFIRSGKKIHPAAMDKITNERMQRKIQADMYSRQQQMEQEQNLNKQSNASMPTKEEIISAINTLSKAGLNPFNPMNSYNFLDSSETYSQFGIYNPMTDIMVSSNSADAAKMLIYAQLAQQNLSYGI